MNSRPPDYESGALPLSYCGKFCEMARPGRRGGESSEPSNTLQSKALASSTHAQCPSCPGADSNRYAFRHHPLKMACLPISPPGQNHFTRAANSIRTLRTHPRSQNKTGPTGLEPATSRVTVECSNQTELRPQLLESGSETPSSLRTFLVPRAGCQPARRIAPRGIEPLSAP